MQNKYEVLGVVGEGAYGIVYKCQVKETHELVAIKKFKETDDEIVKKTMRRELKMLKLLNHENVVEFKEAFKRKENLYLVFEYVERNLLELLQESPSGLEPSLIRNLIYQLCKAIKYLHDQNIIHRDIKPENLLISNDMKLKLCDFGFARKISLNSREILTDYVATRWYRSPELLITGGIYGPEVDYWAIGCIMGELADGNPLFPGENETDQIHCIQKVLGNLPEDQVETFSKNPIYEGKSLLDINRPETLERRYMGKLSKTAISFLKGLLELDPKKRLNGKNVFEHPYFACFKTVPKENNEKKKCPSPKKEIRQVTPPPTTKIILPEKEKEKTPKKVNIPEPKETEKEKEKENIVGMNNNYNTNNSIQIVKPLEKSNNPTRNTTNINIININNFNQNLFIQKSVLNPISMKKGKVTAIQQSKHKSNSTSGSMPKLGMMTICGQFPRVTIQKIKQIPSKPKSQQDSSSSLGFYNYDNKYDNYRSNIVSLSSNKQTGYKTFFTNKNDKYNFNINTNFKNQNTVREEIKQKSSIIEEEDEYNSSMKYNKEVDRKNKSRSVNKMMKTNMNNVHKLSIHYLGGGNQYTKRGYNKNASYYGVGKYNSNQRGVQLPYLGNQHYMSNKSKSKKAYYRKY